jgi:hypothetical protein
MLDGISLSFNHPMLPKDVIRLLKTDFPALCFWGLIYIYISGTS